MTHDDVLAAFERVRTALTALAEGGLVVVADDDHRENEGDLIMAAEKVTPAAINFMAKEGRGLICLALERQRLLELGIPPMTPQGSDHMGTAFTVSIDAREGTTTGISAAERARTIQVAVAPETRPQDLLRPGHVFPLEARTGGVLRRPGHTEAAVDLARLAGLTPAGVICEIMNDDGTMARRPELQAFAAKHGLPYLTVQDLIWYRRYFDLELQAGPEVKLPTVFGDFRAVAFEDALDGVSHYAVFLGNLGEGEPPLVRVHSECLTGDVFGSRRCDCGSQLHEALRQIAEAGRGAVLYLRQEGRGIGLFHKMRAYALQDQGLDTVEANLALGFPADARDYGVACHMLRHLGVRRLRLLTNNPRKVAGLEVGGCEISERVGIRIEPTDHNARYLATKRTKLDHVL